MKTGWLPKLEVIDLLGQPHQRDVKNGRNDDEVWMYCGSRGRSDPAWVFFDEDGRLRWTRETTVPADLTMPENR